MSHHVHHDARLPTLHEWYHVKVNMDGCEECSERLSRLRQTVDGAGPEQTQLTLLQPPSVSLTPNRFIDDCDVSTIDLGPSYYSYEVIPGQEPRLRLLVNAVVLKVKKSYRALRARTTLSSTDH